MKGLTIATAARTNSLDLDRCNDSDIIPRQIPVPATPPIAPINKLSDVIDNRSNDKFHSNTVSKTLVDRPIEKIANTELNSQQPNFEKQEDTRCDESSIHEVYPLENRVKEIASKLSDMGLLPIQAHLCVTCLQEDFAIPEYNVPVDQHILYTLHACKAKREIDFSPRAAHSILVTMEAIIDETLYLSQNFGQQQKPQPLEDASDICYEIPRNKSPCIDDVSSQSDSLKENGIRIDNNDIPRVTETTSFRKPEEEKNIRLHLELSRLQKENEILHLEVNNSLIKCRKLEDMLNMAISGDRVAVQKEIEHVRAQEKADIHDYHQRELGLRSMLTTKDAELNRQHDMVNRLQMDIKRLVYMQEVQAANFTEKERENLVMQREGQALAIENATLNSELSSLRHRLDEEIRRADSSQQYAQSCQYSKNELSADRRRLQETLLRLEGDAEQLRIEHTKLKQQFSSSQDENRRYLAQVQNLGCDIQKRVTDMASLERQRDDFLRKCESLRRTNQSHEREMDKLNQQLKAYVECQDTINHQLVELERSLVTSEHEITMLQSSLIEIQNERGVLQNLLEQERMKRQEYEELASNGKAKEKATFEQLKTLLKEKASLATKLNEANVRLAHLNSRSPLRASKILLDVVKREANAGSSKERIVLSDASCGDESICEQTVVEEASREDGNLDGNLLKYFNIDE